MQETKTAQIDVKDLLGIGMSLVVLVIGLAYGLDVTGDVRDDMTVDSAEYNATVDGITAVSKITSKLPTVAVVIMASVIIGILVRYLWGAYANNM